MSRESKSDSFVSRFNPYRKKYVIQEHSPLFGESYWRTEQRYLSDSLIVQAILGHLAVGYFITHVPNTLGIDVDDHRGTAWRGAVVPSTYLLNNYRRVNERLGLPSLACQSPRGLHIYYVLSERIPAAILFDLASKRLSGLPVEIKPTPTTALRIPEERRLFDPATFQLLGRPFEEVVQSIPVYHPSILFDSTPEQIRETLQEKSKKLRSFRSLERIERAERTFHFYDGDTNDAYKELVVIYRFAGLSEEEALYRFQLKLEQSPLYSGRLRDTRRLFQRIQSSYRNLKFQPRPREQQLSLFNQYIAEELASRQPFAKQREKPVKRFIERILTYCDWHDEIFADPGRTAIFDHLFRYYRKNRKAGLYPLPRNMLKKENSHYGTIMPWLQEEGFIEPAPYKYSAALNICRYYRVQRDGFLMAEVRRRSDQNL